MNNFFDELFTGISDIPAVSKSALPERKEVEKKQRPVSPKKANVTVSRAEKIATVTEKTTVPDSKVNEPQSSDLLERVSAACNENRYLEAMILGEILNKPRFKGLYHR